MSNYYKTQAVFKSNIIGNGFIPFENKSKLKSVYLDVTPAKTPYFNPDSNKIKPMINTLIRNKSDKDVVYENMKPIFTLMRIMGVLPINRPKPGLTQFSVTSSAMIYSFIAYASLVGYILYLSIHKVQIFRSTEGKFEEAVIEYLFTVYLFPVFVVPIIWYETRKIAKLLNAWTDFEVTFGKVSTIPLQTNLFKKAFVMSFAIPILATSSVVVTHTTMVHFKLIQIVPYVYLEILTYLLGGYWYLLCETISTGANILADDFQMYLKHTGPAARVADYRGLWMRLSKLNRETGSANCFSFTFLNLYLFIIITLSIYGLLSQISEGFGVKDIGLTVTALCSMTLLFLICDEAHYASQNNIGNSEAGPFVFALCALLCFISVRTNFQKKLLTVELSWMNTDAQAEVNMFLRATEMNSSEISLGGFFNVNRTLFKSLLATMVTYLVVLLQFQISIPDDNQPVSDGNETNSEAKMIFAEETIATTLIPTTVTNKT